MSPFRRERFFPSVPHNESLSAKKRNQRLLRNIITTEQRQAVKLILACTSLESPTDVFRCDAAGFFPSCIFLKKGKMTRAGKLHSFLLKADPKLDSAAASRGRGGRSMTHCRVSLVAGGLSDTRMWALSLMWHRWSVATSCQRSPSWPQCHSQKMSSGNMKWQ